MASDRLDPYRGKRDFRATPEPTGGGRESGPAGGLAPAGRRFVVQRHRARRLHYDLRLEIDGVLVSWAVPKGPTLDPHARRAAVHVEDHPIEYLDFEGVIPAGEYGGGDVIVWDRGTWEPHDSDDPAAAVAAGELHADMHGEKLRGRLVLIRSGRSAHESAGHGGRGRDGPEQWLLLHKRDAHAVSGWDPEDHPRSVLSGRTSDEVKATRALSLSGPAAKPSAAELDALDEFGEHGTWEIFGRRLRVTNLGKVLFPGRGRERPITKREFLAYAARVAPTILPYLRGRALNMHRFPGGAQTKGFWHKQMPAHAPGWLPRWHNPEAGHNETSTYLVVDEPAALVWAANYGALEWHAWTSRTSDPHQPTYALIDLDPGRDTSWEDLLVLARLHRTALEHLGVRAQPKVTGQRGIQIWIPVTPGTGFGETRTWVEQVSRSVGQIVPGLVSWKWDVSERGGRARLDYTQNAINKTLVAPYSPRAAPGAPVSAPIGWEELDDPSLRPDGYTIRTLPGRLTERGDLFAAVLGPGQALPPVRLPGHGPRP